MPADATLDPAARSHVPTRYGDPRYGPPRYGFRAYGQDKPGTKRK